MEGRGKVMVRGELMRIQKVLLEGEEQIARMVVVRGREGMQYVRVRVTVFLAITARIGGCLTLFDP